jgi:hypothetical protein
MLRRRRFRVDPYCLAETTQQCMGDRKIRLRSLHLFAQFRLSMGKGYASLMDL